MIVSTKCKSKRRLFLSHKMCVYADVGFNLIFFISYENLAYPLITDTSNYYVQQMIYLFIKI